MTYKDYKVIDNYAIRTYENVDCVYIAKVNETNSYFLGFTIMNNNAFIPGGCQEQFLHTICKKVDDIND